MRAFATAVFCVAVSVPALGYGSQTGFYSDGAGVTAEVLESIELCTSVEELPDEQKPVVIDRGVKLAEAAVAAREHDARAHFALFCNLARRAELNGVSVGAVAALTRMEEAVDRALELEPEYLDALVGKGTFLIELPWMLGGDDDEGEQLLRRAVALDPSFTPARERLAKFLEEES